MNQALLKFIGAKLAIVGGVLLSATVPAWGTVTSCPANPTTVTLASISNPDLVGSGNGCWVTNAAYNTFTNFSVGTLSSAYTITVAGNPVPFVLQPDAGVTSPTASQVLLTTAPGAGSSSFELSSPNPNTPTPGGCDTSPAGTPSGGWCVTKSANSIMSSVVSYDITVGTNGLPAIGVSGVYTVHANGQGGGDVAVFLEVCTNNTIFSQSCAGGTYAVVQGGTFTGGFNANVPFNVSTALSGLTTGESVAVRETIYITTGSNGDYGEFSQIDLIDSPEPATFGLIGFSLAGLCGAVLYRRKS